MGQCMADSMHSMTAQAHSLTHRGHHIQLPSLQSLQSCVGCAAADVTPPTLSHSTCRGREAARNDEDPLQDWRCPKCRAAQRELGPEHALRGLAEAVLVAA